MSIRTAASYVPEMILDAPKEMEQYEVVRQIKECVGVAFLRMYRAGCIVTVRGGEGIVMKKRPDGTFSAPVAVNMLGPALGASIGIGMTDFIIFFKTEPALEGFVSNVGTVGLNGSLTAGPLGREAEALVTTKSTEGIIVFASSKGLYGGVSLEFGGVMPNSSANQNEYGRPITAKEIFENEEPLKGDVYDKMYRALDELMNQELPEPKPADELPADEQVVAQQ